MGAAAILLVGGAIAGAALTRGRGNPVYALIFLWALSAILAAGGQRAIEVAGATILAALLVVGGAGAGLRAGGWSHWTRRVWAPGIRTEASA